MSDSHSLGEHTTANGLLSHSFVLFGALGDLSLRKLMPALYQLDHAQLLSEDLNIMAVARSVLSIDQLKQRIEHTLIQ
jgi:glucose-6-phosphate 1-dehydrogenase